MTDPRAFSLIVPPSERQPGLAAFLHTARAPCSLRPVRVSILSSPKMGKETGMRLF
ncbi:hypothetical protein ABZU86_09830 [Streptomyces sp. NPDC005271]|uniref:hypothetical protein n=1 Tax=unclassified Streptomyces TaxID=2593676 RepID=UPI00339ECD03